MQLDSDIYYGWPCNTAHPLNRGLGVWLLAVPWYTSGPVWIDLSGNRRHGTLVNAPRWLGTTVAVRPGGWGCLNIDGTDDHIDMGTLGDAYLRENQELTWAAWLLLRTRGEANAGRLYARGGHVFNIEGTQNLRLRITGGTNFTRTSGNSLFSLNLWTHVTVTHDGSSTAANAHIYLNGIEVSSYATTSNGASPNDNSADSINFAGNAGANTSDGLFDDIRLYDRQLSAHEVRLLYEESRAGYPTALNWIPHELYLGPPAAGGVTVTPTTADLVLATFAPTVSTPRLATPTTATLTLTTFAPTVTVGVRVTPTTAALTTAAFAPTVSTPRLATPTTAELTVATFAPTVTVGQRVTPTTASLTLSAFAPVVSTPRLVTPGTSALTLTTFAPTVTVGAGGVTVVPTTASLTLTTFAPTVSAPQSATPTTAALTLSMFAPTVVVAAPPADRQAVLWSPRRPEPDRRARSTAQVVAMIVAGVFD